MTSPFHCGRKVAFAIALATAAIPHAGLAWPGCMGPLEVANAPVLRVESNGDLVLPDGRAVHLEGIILPAGQKDHAPDYLVGESVDAVKALASGHKVSLALFPPKEDRYGRLRAQVLLSGPKDDSWLQAALLSRGLARVDIAPERRDCAEELYAAEAAARNAHAGIWATGFYTVRSPAGLNGLLGTFQIVQGRVENATISSGRATLDFGHDRRRDFKVTIAPDDLRRFRDIGVDPRNYSGLDVRVRGFVDRLDGPVIEVASPASIEVVRTP
jgi:hypothetical protein